MPKLLAPCPAAWPLCTSPLLKQRSILGIRVPFLLLPVVVTLTVATRPLPVLSCSIFIGNREFAKTIGPRNLLSTNDIVEVEHVTALALRSIIKLLKLLQRLPTILVTPI